ncbi:MAG TPA: hypothetical protein DCZ91_17925 [Lachnospiraceae bacterium]|nr:hypothetical protein [Lachnospiraceae bacterium]
MFYERKVKYLDYYERGERVRGGGHAKLEVRDGRLRLELAVTGMHATDSYARDVLLCAEGRENVVGKIEISEGRGNYRQQWNQLENIGGTGIRYEELCGIRIPLGAGREISCRWPAKSGAVRGEADSRKVEMRAAESGERGENIAFGRIEREAEEVRDDGGRKASAMVEKEKVLRKDGDADAMGKEENRIGEAHNGVDKEEPSGEGRRDELNSREREEGDEEDGRDMRRRRSIGRKENYDREPGETGKPYAAGSAGEQEQKAMRQEQWGIAGEQQAVGQEQRGNVGERRTAEQEPVKLLENKWSQLWEIYPHIRPFNDEREYISIGPSDFVLFPEASYKRANNSFLLHGFYNYRHLLLARVERRGEVMYYIGVPGTFFEKEKQVAVMFGFESFECEEEPAQAGDFGYYMMRTAL